MSWPVLFLIVVLFCLLASGAFISVALGFTGIVVLMLFSGGKEILSASIAWSASNSFVLCTVPLFILMGQILQSSGASQKLYSGMTTLTQRLPGGLLQSNIAACAVFAAMCGVSIATSASIGAIAMKEEIKRGYSPQHVFGSIAAGGTLGILIPPSVPMIIYAVMVEESIGRLFIAGVIPGALLSLCFMAYIFVIAKKNPSIAPREATKIPGLTTLLGLLAPGFLILLVLGGMFSGFATPTEAAALGVVGALIVTFAYGSFELRVLKSSILNTARTTSMIMFIFVGANILSFTVADLGVVENATHFVVNLKLSPIIILIGIFLLYLFLGCLFEPVSMMVMTLPVIFPVITGLGYNPVWFGTVLVVLIEASLITPPVGLNLFIIQGIARDYPSRDVILGSLPYVIIMILLIVLLTAFPGLCLWLPNKFF